MSYERLAQAVPPSYAQLVFGQMCMHAAHARFGSPLITFDEMLRRPDSARRELASWLRGAGEASPTAGMALWGAAPPRECSAAGVRGYYVVDDTAAAPQPTPIQAGWSAGRAAAEMERAGVGEAEAEPFIALD